jgi:hypothetical protein
VLEDDFAIESNNLSITIFSRHPNQCARCRVYACIYNKNLVILVFMREFKKSSDSIQTRPITTKLLLFTNPLVRSLNVIVCFLVFNDTATS